MRSGAWPILRSCSLGGPNIVQLISAVDCTGRAVFLYLRWGPVCLGTKPRSTYYAGEHRSAVQFGRAASCRWASLAIRCRSLPTLRGAIHDAPARVLLFPQCRLSTPCASSGIFGRARSPGGSLRIRFCVSQALLNRILAILRTHDLVEFTPQRYLLPCGNVRVNTSAEFFHAYG